MHIIDSQYIGFHATIAWVAGRRGSSEVVRWNYDHCVAGFEHTKGHLS